MNLDDVHDSPTLRRQFKLKLIFLLEIKFEPVVDFKFGLKIAINSKKHCDFRFEPRY